MHTEIQQPEINLRNTQTAYYELLDKIMGSPNPIASAESKYYRSNKQIEPAPVQMGLEAFITAADRIFFYERSNLNTKPTEEQLWNLHLDGYKRIYDQIRINQLVPSYGTIRFSNKNLLTRVGLKNEEAVEFNYFRFTQIKDDPGDFDEIDDFLLSHDVRQALESVLAFTADSPDVFQGMTLQILSALDVRDIVREAGNYLWSRNTATIFNPSTGVLKHELGHFAIWKGIEKQQIPLPFTSEGMAQLLEFEGNFMELMDRLHFLQHNSLDSFSLERIRKILTLEWKDVKSLMKDFPNNEMSFLYFSSAAIFNSILDLYTDINKGNKLKAQRLLFTRLKEFHLALLEYRHAIKQEGEEETISEELYLETWQQLFESHMGITLEEAYQISIETLNKFNF